MSSSAVDEAAQQLIDCLDSQRRWYESFSALSRRQMQIITEGQATELLGVLAQKQQVLEKIDEVEKRLGPLKGQWPTLREAMPAPERARVERAIDDVRDVLAEVIELERQSERSLCERKQATQEEIDRTAQGRQMHNAYSAANRRTGNRYLDMTDG